MAMSNNKETKSNHHIEKAALLLGEKNRDKNVPPSSSLSHFLTGLVGVVAGSMLVRYMETCVLTNGYRSITTEQHQQQDPIPNHVSKTVVMKGDWLERYSISRGVVTTAPDGTRHLHASGQAPFDGREMIGSDVKEQFQAELEFTNETLQAADMNVCDVVRMNVFTTDTNATLAAWNVFNEWIAPCSVKPVSTLVGVASLFSPDAYIEIEIEAMK